MTYEDALIATVTRAEARAEVAQHGADLWPQFIADAGDRAEYEGAEILNWLGY